MPERDGKDQEEGIPKQADSCWVTHHCWLATCGANLYPPGVWFEDVMPPFFFGITFILFRFRLHTFIEAAALRSIVLRYAGAPTATRVSSSFPVVYLEMSLFPSILCTNCRSLCMEHRPYVFPFRMMFSYLVNTG